MHAAPTLNDTTWGDDGFGEDDFGPDSTGDGTVPLDSLVSDSALFDNVSGVGTSIPPGSRPVERPDSTLAASDPTDPTAPVVIPRPSAFSVPARALVCNTTATSQRPPGLQVFGDGQYRLTKASARDGTDIEALDHLEWIAIPGVIGTGSVERTLTTQLMFGPGLNGYTGLEHGNFMYKGGSLVQAGWRKTESPGIFSGDPPGFLKHAMNGGWCIASTPGMFYVRLGIGRDMRWESKGLANMLWHKSLGHSDKRWHRYIGLPVYPWTLPDTGFPVQSYSVVAPVWDLSMGAARERVAQANASADQLYRYQDQSKSMRYFSYEMELWGATDWRDTTWRVCRRHLTGTSCRTRHGIAVHRKLIGEIRMRVRKDFRVGVPGHSEGGGEIRMSVEFESEPLRLQGGDAVRLKHAIGAVCAGARGCAPKVPFPIAQGSVTLPGSDDSTRADEMCQQQFPGGSCQGEKNGFVAHATKTEGSEAAAAAGDPSRPNFPTNLTAAELRSTRSGRRGELSVQSELERSCRAQAESDSASTVDGPVDYGAARPVVTSAWVSAAVSACLATSADMTDPPVTPAAPRSNPPQAPSDGPRPAPRPAARPTQQRCYEYFGRLHCVPATQPR